MPLEATQPRAYTGCARKSTHTRTHQNMYRSGFLVVDIPTIPGTEIRSRSFTAIHWEKGYALVKSTRILIEITRILIDIIVLVKIRIPVDFTRNIVIRIPIISIRIPIKLNRTILICPFSTRNFFQCTCGIHLTVMKSSSVQPRISIHFCYQSMYFFFFFSKLWI